MLRFLRTRDCRGCQAIQGTLEELSLAHEVVVVSGPTDAAMPPGNRPPLLVDEGRSIQGSEKIIAHLQELEGLKSQWERFQSDACYCDEQGNVE
jgi:hypothetical protein